MILPLLFSLIVIGSCTFNYNVNEELSYKVDGVTHSSGNEDTSNQLFVVQGTAVFTVLNKIDTKTGVGYRFKMNLIDTTMGTSDEGYDPDPEESSSLQHFEGNVGYPIPFDIDPLGKVIAIYPPIRPLQPEEEDEGIINIKHNIIDAFQTNLEQKQSVKFESVNGVYNADVTVTQDKLSGKITSKREYTQNDFIEHSDDVIDSLKAGGSYKFSGSHNHVIENGAVFNVEIAHSAVYRKIYKDPPVHQDEGYLFSEGKLNLELVKRVILNGVNSYKVNSNESSTLNVYGKDYVENYKAAKYIWQIEDEVDKTMTELFSLEETDVDFEKKRVKLSNTLIWYLGNRDDLFMSKFKSKVDLNYPLYSRSIKDAVFYILSIIGSKECQNMMVRHGMFSSVEDEQLMGILSSHHVDVPSEYLLESLYTLYTSSNSSYVKSMSLLAIGSIAKRIDPSEKSPSYYEKLILEQLNDTSKMEPDQIVVVLHAVLNAELNITKDMYNNLVALKIDRITVLAKEIFQKSPEERDALTSGKLALDQGNDIDFPYNKHDGYTKSLGNPKYAEVYGFANYFIGSNFDCKHSSFNYKAYGELVVNATLFSSHKSIVHGLLIYGKKGKTIIGNQMFLSVVGKTIWAKDIPIWQRNCADHVKNLYHSQHLFSIHFSLMVGPVPVTIGIDGSLVLNLDYRWNICDAILGGEVKLVPGVTFVLEGTAAVNIKLVKGGVYIDVSFNVELVPRAYVHGVQCRMGTDLVLDINPFNFEFACKIHHWHLHCGWGNMHKKALVDLHYQKIEKTLWEKYWDIPI